MGVTIKMEAGSVRAAVKNLGKVSDETFTKAARKALRAAGLELKAGIRTNVKRTDYTLGQLEAMGHPYAKRHGSIQVHKDRPYVVHKQSGRMSRKITGQSIGSGRNIRFRVGFNYDAVEHAKYVVEGTRVMLPRDVVFKTSQEPAVRKAMMLAIIRVMGKEFRTGAGLRFG